MAKKRQRSRNRGHVIHGNASANIQVYNEDHLPDLLDKFGKEPFILVLDGIQDPHNLGAILRTADCAGVNMVIAPRDRACPLTETAVKVSCGGAENVPFVQVKNLAREMEKMAQRGIFFVGTADEAKQNFYQIDLTGAIGIVIGAEGRGVRRLVADRCDHLAVIPMRGKVDCLNASVASGVCLFEAVRQQLTRACSI